VGNYFVKLHGRVDALVFAGGIGEKSALLRQAVTQECSSLGFDLDAQRNSHGAEDDKPVTDLTRDYSSDKKEVKPRVLICQTDEQFQMAYHSVNHMKI
jgi:acetate kinase